MRKASSMLLLLLSALAFVPDANAAILQYVYTGSLSLASGPDTAGLDGASFRLEAEFSTFPNTYVEGGTDFPITSAASASFTISGATVAANNGVYELTDVAFAPTVATLEGIAAIGLPVGGFLAPDFSTVSTVSGAMAEVGSPVLPSDFGPTSSSNQIWGIGHNLDFFYAFYEQTGTSINVSIVPEPATTALVALALIGLAGRRLLRKRTSAPAR